MKKWIWISSLFIFGCGTNNDYALLVSEHDAISNINFEILDEPGRAILYWYLFAYGNECQDSKGLKCKILEKMKIQDECDENHIAFMEKWVKNNVLMQYKLQKCPNLPYNFAVKNIIEKIDLHRHRDTITMRFKVRGINALAEKSWNIDQTAAYLVDGDSVIQLSVK